MCYYYSCLSIKSIKNSISTFFKAGITHYCKNHFAKNQHPKDSNQTFRQDNYLITSLKVPMTSKIPSAVGSPAVLGGGSTD